jgi:hypothetical protein
MNTTDFVVLLVAMMFVVVAQAGGGKVSNPWQPINPEIEVCTAFLPAGLDLDDCEELASTSSGKTYLCETLDEYTVFCPDDPQIPR